MASTGKTTPLVVNRPIKAALEREIKLSADSTFRFPPSLGRPIPARRLTTKYYDTRDYRLARAGIALRRRREGGRGLWQLKLPARGARMELETAGSPGLPPSRFQELLMALVRKEPLKEIATLRTHREGVQVTTGNGDVAEVVVDLVSVLDGRRIVRRFREIEAELLKGEGDLLDDIEKALRKAGAGDHDGRPKVLRALDRAGVPSLDAPSKEAPLSRHLAYSLTRHVHTMLMHDPGTRLGKDTESVHQMRVATRRVRAILRAAGPLLASTWVRPLRDDLVWLGGLLGPVRDLDVQIASLRREAKMLDAHDRRPLIRFVNRLQSEREGKQGALLAGLRSARYVEFIERLVEAANEPSVIENNVTLKDIAAREFKRLRKTVGRLDATPTDSDLHRVRIKTKRARYAAELAESVVGHRATRFIRSAKALQDLLGKHQDAVVGEQRVRTLFAEAKGQRAAFTAGRIVERLRHRRDDARAAFRPLWNKVNRRGKKAWK
jgi:CHAD domain-containing protein